MCLSLKFHPNGYQILSGGDDNQLKLWDLRKKGLVQPVAAHFKIISGIHFEPLEGKFALTCSYDGKCKIWNTRDWVEI